MDVLKDWMDNAASECALSVPSLFATNTTTSYTQLKRYMYDTARELLERHDWANCTIDYSITGTGTDTYALPSDFKRLTRSDDDAQPAVWSDDMRRAFKPITSNGQWTVLQSVGPTPIYGYRVVGANIEFSQDIATGETVTISYVSTGWISHSSARTDEWANDADLTYLPGKLIELGTIWRWMRKRGQEFSSYQGEYEMILSRMVTDDRGQRVINMGEAMRQASPYDALPVPILGAAP